MMKKEDLITFVNTSLRDAMAGYDLRPFVVEAQLKGAWLTVVSDEDLDNVVDYMIRWCSAATGLNPLVVIQRLESKDGGNYKLVGTPITVTLDAEVLAAMFYCKWS